MRISRWTICCLAMAAAGVAAVGRHVRAEDGEAAAAAPPAAAAGAVHGQPVHVPAEPQGPAIPIKYMVPAKQLFGSVRGSAPLAARSIGSYSRGCLAGANALPIDGPNWQAMRLSRNRNWGHPELVHLVERFADEAWRYEGWTGLLVGDMSQPRGGPMLTGHASHQIGLDADIWFTQMPDHRMSEKERETLEATSMLAADEVNVNPQVWTPTHAKLVKRAASYDNVERVLVHPAIKKALCQSADGDRGWLNKVRPYFGHYYHFHVRIGCPAGVQGCTPQVPVPGDDGCGKELTDWLKRVTPKHPEPKPAQPEVARKEKERPPVTLDQLPAECRVVLNTGTPGIPKELLAAQKRADVMTAAAKAQAALAKAALAKAHAAKHAAKPADAAAAAPAAAAPAQSPPVPEKAAAPAVPAKPASTAEVK